MRGPTLPSARAVAVAVAAAMVAAVLAGCGAVPFVRGSGNVVQTSPDVEPFDTLVVGSAFDVTLSFGEEPSLLLRTDDNLVEHIELTASDDVLSLALDRTVSDATLDAELTVPADALSSIELNGASSLTATEPITSAQLHLRASGASRAFILVQTDTLDVGAEGASVVSGGGRASSLIVDARGASSIRLSELEAQSADVTAAGASRVDISVSVELRARASGASTVRYAGAPASVERESSGASTIEPG